MEGVQIWWEAACGMENRLKSRSLPPVTAVSYQQSEPVTDKWMVCCKRQTGEYLFFPQQFFLVSLIQLEILLYLPVHNLIL